MKTDPRLLSFAGSLLLGVSLAACGSGGSGSQTGGTVGTVNSDVNYPAGFLGSPAGFFVDPNKGGTASAMRITNMYWGRLVDLFDQAPNGSRSLQRRNYVVGEEIQSDGTDLELVQNPVTGQLSLTILHKAGTNAFEAVFNRLDDNLGPVHAKSLAPSEIPPFSFLARNAALVVQFDDLLDHDSITTTNLKVLTGYPPITPFEPRLIPDPNYGGAVEIGGGDLEFRSSRVIIDMTVSDFETLGSDPPLAVNLSGLPPSVTTLQPNVAMRIPSQISPGANQFTILQNFTGHGVANTSNGPVDLTSTTVDVVRAMRSGGNTSVTGDEFNGFLEDMIRPRLVGSQGVTIDQVTPDPASGTANFLVRITFDAAVCAQQPVAGDAIELADGFLMVTQDASDPAGAIVTPVAVELVVGDPLAFFGGQGSFSSAFDADVDTPDCFFEYTPEPLALPDTGVSPIAQIITRFSEPMNPATVLPFDTFTVTDVSETDPLRRRIVGEITPSSDLREFRFTPTLPLDHVNGSSELFDVELTSGLATGLTDLAGNALETLPPAVRFRLDPDADTRRSGSLVLSFASGDEDGNGTREFQGEIVPSFDRGVILPRPVSRFSYAADRHNLVPNFMVPTVPPPAAGTNGPLVQEPLNPLGAKLMTLWRHIDLGIEFEDLSLFNIDVDRLNWAPLPGQVTFETYPLFEMRLGHSARTPDESFDPSFMVCPGFCFPASGLMTATYDENYLDDPKNPGAVVHERTQGYEINPVNTFNSTFFDTAMHPFPLNTDPDISQHEYFTWRDTDVQNVDGADSSGIAYNIEMNAGVIFPEGVGVGTQQASGMINSLGLPLLMEFRCYPTGSTNLSPNVFDTSIAQTAGALPIFRLFSAGGFNAGGFPVAKDPDLEPIPTGGFVPGTMGMPATTSTGFDNLLYIGQADFIVRISRAYTIWFDTGNAASTYLQPVVEPLPENQPSGTSLSLAFRGATNVVASGMLDPGGDADDFDSYGDIPDFSGTPPLTSPDMKNMGVTFLEADDFRWSGAITDVDGRQFIQVRVTFVNNTATDLSPELSALGIPFEF